MTREPLSDCTYCRSAGSISNGYCMICGAAGPQRPVYLSNQRPATDPGRGATAPALSQRAVPARIGHAHGGLGRERLAFPVAAPSGGARPDQTATIGPVA